MSGWRRRRRLFKWLDESEEWIAKIAALAGKPAPQPFPRDVARENPELAIEGTLAMLRAMRAYLAGGDAAAVFEEHSPAARLGGDGS